jgi:hypothetical protein
LLSDVGQNEPKKEIKRRLTAGLDKVGFIEAQALAHARQPKVLVLEFESFDGILSPKDQGIFIFDKPFKVLALFQLNRVG